MRENRRRRKRRQEILQAWLIVLLLLTGTGTVMAKYIYSAEFQGKVAFSVSLAEAVGLWESKAVRHTDGTYTLTAEKTTENTYLLLPGVDIPKDPYILIRGKTPQKAYLYIEVVDQVNNQAIQYETDDNWDLITGLEGAHGGRVYIYREEIDETFSDKPIYILKGNQIEVSQKLNQQPTKEMLGFYGCLGEIPADEEANDPEKIYRSVYRLSE